MTVTWLGAGKRTERGQDGHGVLFNEQAWYDGTWCAVQRAAMVHCIRCVVHDMLLNAQERYYRDPSGGSY